jgi:hypothetical protein
MIKIDVAKKYKDAVLVALGGFFFLRFVGPPITEPEFFGILKGMLSTVSQSSITSADQDGKSKKAERSVGGLLLKIANNAEYSEKGKYPHLAVLNPFIQKQYIRLTQFLDAISVPSPLHIILFLCFNLFNLSYNNLFIY